MGITIENNLDSENMREPLHNIIYIPDERKPRPLAYRKIRHVAMNFYLIAANRMELPNLDCDEVTEF